MTIDSLVFLGESIFGNSVTPEKLFADLDAAGIDRAVAAPMKPSGYHLGPANDALAAAVAASEGRLTGLVRVDPLLGAAAVAEAERGIRELGFRGIFLHPWEETFLVNDPRVDAVVEVARATGVPVVIASGYPWLSEGLQVGEVAKRFPDVTFVATNGLQINMSGLGQTDAELALTDNPNIVIQTTGVYRDDFIVNAVKKFGPERVLFASKYPNFDPKFELLRVRWSDFDAAQQALMLSGNAERLFG